MAAETNFPTERSSVLQLRVYTQLYCTGTTSSTLFNPWNAPGPKRDFILSLGFALQRANSRMLRNADRRRRNARGCGLYSSGTRPSSSDDDY